MKSRNFLLNAALMLASTLLTVAALFGIGEVALRWKFGALPPGSPPEMMSYDERRGWSLRPGDYSYFEVKAMRSVHISINELGLRNAPFARESAPRRQRITLLGDSFVFGAPLDAAMTIPARLQQLAGDAFEVLNVGILGYGTGQEYRLVEDLHAKGYALGSKVVLEFFTNDILDNLGLLYANERNPLQPVFSIDRDGNLREIPGRPPRLHARTSGGSLFTSYVRYQLEVLAVSHPRLLAALQAIGLTPALPRTPGVIAGWYGSGWESSWQLTAGLVERLVGLLRGLPEAPQVFIAFVPSPFQIHESFQRIVAAAAATDERCASFLADPDRPQRVLEALARRLDAPFIDLTPALRRSAKTVLYFPREGHFNQAGAAIAAQALYERVIAREENRGAARARAARARRRHCLCRRSARLSQGSPARSPSTPGWSAE